MNETSKKKCLEFIPKKFHNRHLRKKQRWNKDEYYSNVSSKPINKIKNGKEEKYFIFSKEDKYRFIIK